MESRKINRSAQTVHNRAQLCNRILCQSALSIEDIDESGFHQHYADSAALTSPASPVTAKMVTQSLPLHLTSPRTGSFHWADKRESNKRWMPHTLTERLQMLKYNLIFFVFFPLRLKFEARFWSWQLQPQLKTTCKLKKAEKQICREAQYLITFSFLFKNFF